MTKKEKLIRGESSIEILRNQGIDVAPLSESYEKKETIIKTGERIRSMRLDAGLTQEELANAADMSQADISRIESGRGTTGPGLQTIYRLAEACNYKSELVLKPKREPSKKAQLPVRPRHVVAKVGTARPEHYLSSSEGYGGGAQAAVAHAVKPRVRAHARTNSIEMQVEKLTAQITSNNQTKHLGFSRGRTHMLRLVHQRRKLLQYLKENDPNRYQNLIKRLNLRR